MEITTARFGKQTADPEKTIYFPVGIAGFEECTHFQLFHETKKNHVVYYLQSMHEAGLMLNTIQPELIGLKYDFTLTDDNLALLDTDTVDTLVTLCVISKDPDKNEIVPHPDCPIIINTANKRGIQIKAGEIILDEKSVSKAA